MVVKAMCMAILARFGPDIYIVFGVERNLGHPGYLVRPVTEVVSRGRYWAIAEKGDEDYGWRTTRESKVIQAQTLKDLLEIGQPSFIEDFICPGCYDDVESDYSDNQKRGIFLEKLDDQMKRYTKYVKETSDPLSNPKATMSGKIGEDGKKRQGLHDDGIVALGFAVWLAIKIANEEVPRQPRVLCL